VAGGTESTAAGVLDLRFAVPTKDAFWVLDPPNGRIRRIWR
jgi:hypothetical protein